MKDKICLICHTVIDTEKPFCKFEHYQNKKIIKSKAYYHVECFRDRMNGSETQNELAKKAMHLLNSVEGRIN
jgi:hypothetical protein